MNRLADETSPYLRQHADNPVDWYPWGDEAFAAAAARDVPVLLSVGYSACHWCHVMAHECFEDDAIARLMNDGFVNVKVDREERPDVDAVYMDAVQALTGQGGWPMTVFLTPAGEPFYGGTYFPPADRGSVPGFPRILAAISDVWANQRDDVTEQSTKLVEAIRENTLAGLTTTADGPPLDPVHLDAAVAGIREAFDPVDGGFGRAPKFPPAMTVDVLVRAHLRGVPDVLPMITTTLDAMAAGGIYDHVGGGFARYSTDTVWLVPHFEKMLYDQALLVGAYLRAHLLTGVPRYREVVEETVEYVLRDLRHPAGGFFCAEDADSEGVEGKFYLWSPEQVRNAAGADADELLAYFAIDDAPNFRDPHTGWSGTILAQRDRGAPRTDGIRRGLAALRATRADRVRPGRDEKVLTAWNALFTTSLLEAAAAFARDDWMAAATANLEFLLAELRPDVRLHRSWHADGGARHLAVAEDHAALLGALLTAAELDDIRWLLPALDVAAALDDLFADPATGGYFTTGSDAEALVVRPQDFFDNATPSENSLAADAMLRLAAITGDAGFGANARRLLASLGPAVVRYPTAFGRLLGAYERALAEPLELAIVGPDPALRTAWASTLHPNAVGVRSPTGEGRRLTPLLEGRPYDGVTTRAYLCRGFVCEAPVTTPEELRAAVVDERP